MALSYDMRSVRCRCIPFRCALWVLAFLCMGVTFSRGATISLHVYTSAILQKSDASTPLANGSYVMIVGSSDDQRELFQTYGGTNLLTDLSTDILIGTLTLINGNGSFDSGGFTYDSDVVSHLYVYFFDNSTWPIEGITDWGYTVPVAISATQEFTGSVSIDLAGDIVSASNTDNFVVIPEPTTASLLLFFIGMAALGAPGLVRRIRGNVASNDQNGNK